MKKNKIFMNIMNIFTGFVIFSDIIKGNLHACIEFRRLQMTSFEYLFQFIYLTRNDTRATDEHQKCEWHKPGWKYKRICISKWIIDLTKLNCLYFFVTQFLIVFNFLRFQSNKSTHNNQFICIYIIKHIYTHRNYSHICKKIISF